MSWRLTAEPGLPAPTPPLSGLALVDRVELNMTGLKRYSSMLSSALQKQGIYVDQVEPQLPVPEAVASLAGRWGWDLPTFFGTYPVAARLRGRGLYHLASETMAAMLAFRKPDAPSVVTVHAFFTYLLRHERELSSYNHAADRVFDRLAARGLRRATALIAVSHYVKACLNRELSVPLERIHVVHEAVDHEQFRPLEVPDRFRRSNDLPESRRYVLYVGSEQPRKNFLGLLRAFARLHRRHPDTVLLKVGQCEVQPERQRALDLIDELGISDAVRFFGHVGDELPLFYNVADVFAFPSRFEGFGFPPLEAMACGTPVVCSNSTSLPEVTGDAALSIDPGDEDELLRALECLLENERLREDYRRRGLERSARFQWERTARETADVYHQVLSSRS